ncbi:MAG: hypothetical protein J5382_10690 [Bacteroidales bacterium]|nr:hypothetical protein [Bacteroidales bacterium]
MCSLFQPKVDVELKVPEDKRDIDSEIDWKIIDQLHNVVLNFSRNSMQAKKILFTMLGIFVASLLQLDDKIEAVKWFPFVIFIVILFWAFDSYTYYYQEKIRAQMDVRFHSLKKRYPSTNQDDEFTLPDSRKSCGRLWRSIFNGSVLLFYPFVILLIVVLWVLIARGIFV